jgi:hypothetical protein
MSDNHFELFVRSNQNNLIKTKTKTKKYNLSESITSVENLSDTSESDQSKNIINTISTQLKVSLDNIN